MAGHGAHLHFGRDALLRLPSHAPPEHQQARRAAMSRSPETVVRSPGSTDKARPAPGRSRVLRAMTSVMSRRLTGRTLASWRTA
jgi:hypothetical protein